MRISLRLPNRQLGLAVVATGVLLAFHWWTFFHAIQLSSVALGLLTFASFPLFVALFEPILFREPFRRLDLGLVLLVGLGLVLVLPSFDFGERATMGAVWGIVSGFTFAFFSMANRKIMGTLSPLPLVFYQNAVACLCFVPFFWTIDGLPQGSDLGWLLLLGIFNTGLAHVLFVRSLSCLKTRLVSIITCLEPVYGIALALVLLGEVPTGRTLAGGLLILGTTIAAVRLRERAPDDGG